MLLNTDFAGPQLAEVCRRERIRLLIHDAGIRRRSRRPASSTWARCTAWTDGDSAADSLDSLIEVDRSGPAAPAGSQPADRAAHQRHHRHPEGRRARVRYLAGDPGRLPVQDRPAGRRPVYVAVPVFHAWGLLSSMIALALTDTLVLARRAEPAEVAAAWKSIAATR